MRNIGYSKLIYLLSALSTKDHTLFRDYLNSPVFNKKREAVALFEYCLQNCLGNPLTEVNDYEAHEKIWPGDKVVPKRMNKLKSTLVNLIMGYLEYRNWRADTGSRQLAQIKELNHIHDESYLPRLHAKALKKTKEEVNLKTSWLQLEHAIQYMQFLNRHAPRKAASYLDESLIALEEMILVYTLKFAFMTVNQSQIIGAAPFPAWLGKTIETIQRDQLTGSPLLEIYYLLYLTHPADASMGNLLRLKKLVIENSKHCTRSEAFDIYTGTLNNFNRQMPRQKTFYLPDIFDLYQSMVAIYVRQLGGKLTVAHLKNIVSLGMRLNHFKWVEALLSDAKKLLGQSGASLKLALDYNYGVHHFYRREFERATRQFYTVLADAEDVFYAADARGYLLMCLYETGDSMGMESLMHSFKMYLRRNKGLSDHHKKKHLAFLRAMGHLLSTPSNDKIRLQKLLAEIAPLKASTSKEWLLEKVEELLSKII